MSIPKPDSSIDGGCSVVHDNTLYVYTSSAFQSLSLEKGGKWTPVDSTTAVTGAACVGSNPDDDAQAGFFVVGGTSDDPAYQGLAKFTYATGEWSLINPQVNVITGLTDHSATYLKAADSILVYSGSSDGTDNPSSSSYAIKVTAPFEVASKIQNFVPAANAPILLPWNNDQQAFMIGGSTGDPLNRQAILYDSDASAWVNPEPPISLAAVPAANAKGALVTGTDGSLSLMTFDLAQSPPSIARFVLIDADGNAVADSASLVGRKRQENPFPTYNDTFAPTTSRSEYSIAPGSDGQVVFSGGNADEPVVIFDMMANEWANMQKVLVKQPTIETTESSSSSTKTSTKTSSSASPTKTHSSAISTTSSAATTTPTSDSTSHISSSSATPTPTGGAAELGSDSSGGDSMKPTTLLGIVLGTIFGVAILLLILLFCLKRTRKRRQFQEQTHARRMSGPHDEKGYYSADPIGKPPAPTFQRGHQQQGSRSSISSMAILMGKVQSSKGYDNQSASRGVVGVQRKPSDSDRSSVSSIFNTQFKSAIGRPQPQETQDQDFMRDEKSAAYPAAAAQPRARNAPPADPDDPTRRSSGWNRYWSGGSNLNIIGFGQNGRSNQDPSRRETVASSFYSDGEPPNRMTQDSATVPPLKVESRPEFNSVNSASPRISHYNNPFLGEGMSGQIERPISSGSAGSGVSNSRYSSGIPESVRDTWDPSHPQAAWGTDRAPSSTYSGVSGNMLAGTQTGAQPGNRGRSPSVGLSRQPQLDTAVTSDMSWLNLGENNGAQSKSKNPFL